MSQTRAPQWHCPLQFQSVQDELLESFHRRLEFCHGQRLVVTVGHEDTAWSIQISCVVALEGVDIRAIVGHESVEAYNRGK